MNEGSKMALKHFQSLQATFRFDGDVETEAARRYRALAEPEKQDDE